MKILNLRLSPGQDLKKAIAEFCNIHNLQASTILSGVGSLKKTKLRLAGADKYLDKADRFEIVSLTGTCSIHGIHLHASIADQNGQVFGGHLMEENIIYTTAELVFLEQTNVKFERSLDEQTGYKELKIT